MINPQHFTYAILMMALITFSVRYAFFTSMVDIKLTPAIKNILTFTAPCVLTAMLVPIMFQDMLTMSIHGTSTTSINTTATTSTIFQMGQILMSSSYFWASMFALLASFFIRQTLLVIILSMLVFYALRLFIFV